MPTFEIPDGPTTVKLQRSGDAANPGPATGSVVFNVTNKSTDSSDGRLSVVPSGTSKEEWFTIDGDRERTFAAGETQTATIKVSAPKEVTAGDYPFRLRAVAVLDPDNDHAEGPVVTATVPAAAAVVKHGIPWWVWLIIGLVVLAAIGGGIWFAFLRDHGDKGDKKETIVTAPDLSGKTVDQAKQDAKGFTIVADAGQPSGKEPGTIVSQDPGPKKPVGKSKEIKVTFDPGVDVPQVANKGLTLVDAVNTLSNAKLAAGQVTSSCQPSGMAGEVIKQDPEPPQKAALNGRVQLAVRVVDNMLGGRRIRCGLRLDARDYMSRISNVSVIEKSEITNGTPFSERANVRDHRTKPGG